MKLITNHKLFTRGLSSLLFAVLCSLGPNTVQAADHGDAPVASNSGAADIADVFFFLDPNDNDQVVLIATIRGFIPGGENSNFGIFDPTVRYHFEIETSGPPDTKADKFIDVTFSPRSAIDGPSGKDILQVPQAQKASIKLTGFSDSSGKIKGFDDVPTTPSSTAGTAPAQVVTDLETSGIKFFAGMVDDPFFFDIPAFGAFIASVRNNAPDPTVFNRGRDSFAGYNVMGIALRMPATLIRGSTGTVVGVAFYTQKQIVQAASKKTGEVKGTGAFKTLDRMGNPAVNVALIPFNRKNEYNQGTPKDDAKLRFGGDILKTLAALGTKGADVFPPTDNALALAQVAVLNGDYLRLQTDKTVAPNTGPGGGGPATALDPYGNGFPNGRRLRDDTVDILLTLIANGNPFTNPPTGPLGDNVNASDPLPRDTFPFLAPPNQPFPNGTLDDKTRN
jgi:hypothetical protein